ncbi:hypothetical protein EB093_09555, partial [bacterium]|nr:hypothetical protein [bacterium]
GTVTASVLSGTHTGTWSGNTIGVANGGTGVSSLTSGRVLFGNGVGAIGTTTTADLHWDNTNYRLGIGHVSPTSKLYVFDTGANYFGSTIASDLFRIVGRPVPNLNDKVVLGTFGANASSGGNDVLFSIRAIRVAAGANHTGVAMQLSYDVDATEAQNGRLSFYGNKIGIGTVTPSSALDVVGTVKATSFAGDGSGLTGITATSYSGTMGVTSGGTGTTTAFTQGSVVFAGASGVYGQNNAQLFWDSEYSVGCEWDDNGYDDYRKSHGDMEWECDRGDERWYRNDDGIYARVAGVCRYGWSL